MSLKKIKELLKDREFISVATSDLEAHPNAAPKFILKIEDHFIYLVDYILGKTWQNLKTNPLVSLSLVNTDTLTGYQINGVVEIIDRGKEFESILKELLAKEMQLSTKRIVEGVTSGKSHG
ncbi:MAG: pyridoxamine 5'-phosphate oxidase family protein, partial [Candidatus Omnitrophota bacterium]